MMNDVQRESLAFVESCITLSGCDRETAEEALRELAEATVGTPCPVDRAKRRMLDRLELVALSRWSSETRIHNALDYAKSFMLSLKIG